MTEETAVVPPTPSKILEKSVTSIDGATVYTVRKLKAEKYYQAQKAYVEWLKTLQGAMTKGTKITDDISKMKNADGSPDIEAIKAALDKSGNVNILDVLSGLEDSNKYRLEVLAIGLDRTITDIMADMYPEDMDAVMDAIIETNNFVENLKNAVAPIVGLGATTQAA